MLHHYLSSNSKTRQITALLVIVLVAAIGSYLLIGSHAASPYVSTAADSGTLGGSASEQSCGGASDGNCVIFGGTSTQQTDCFASPGKCGYPDPNPPYQNVGVPPAMIGNLQSSGSITIDNAYITANGGLNSSGRFVLNGLDVAGNIEVAANNVTIENTRITANDGGCGPTNGCGNSDIKIDSGVTGTLIEHVELTSATGTTLQEGVRNLSDASNTGEAIYAHGTYGPDNAWFGAGTIKDSYFIAAFAITNDHIEDVYDGDGTMTLTHNTLLNPTDQTAILFGNNDNGQDNSVACDNHFTVTDNLMAGGGYMFYPCAHTASVGTSTMDISDNRFARCGGGNEVESGGSWICPGGADSNGYWPRGGSYGVDADAYCAANNNQIWSNNVWDDNNAPVSCE